MNSLKRTNWSRRNREVLTTFTGARVEQWMLDRVRLVAKSLNVDVSDLLRAYMTALTLLPLKPNEIGISLDEIKNGEKINSPATSDKIRYV